MYEMIKHIYLDGIKDYYEFAVDYSDELESLPNCVGGSTAVVASGLKFVKAPSGGWSLDMSSYGASADVLGELPHTLHIKQGTNSTLSVDKGGSAVTDGAIVYNGDTLTVTYAGSTGYDVVCTINGVAAKSSPATYNVGVGSNVMIETVATIKTYDLSVTAGENTAITIVDSEDNEYTDGDKVEHGTVLTVTAVADDGYTLTTFTIGGEDATSPAEHVMVADVTILTAATE